MKKYRSKKAGENIIRTYDQLVKNWGVAIVELEVETSFGTTHIITAGELEAKPLLLFHGVGDDSALIWAYNAKALARRYRIYAIDTIGGPGKSTMGENYYQRNDDAAWIAEIMERLGITKSFFAGVSHGGYLIQLFTQVHPEKVEKAISISGAVPCGKGSGTMRTMMKIFLPEALIPTRKNIIKLLKKLSGQNYQVFTENPVILEHFAWLMKGFNNRAMTYHKVRAFEKAEVDAIREQVYYLVGEEDPFQKIGGKEALIAQHMNAHFYAGAGHGLNHELAEEINEMMIDIFEGRKQNIRNY